MPFDDQIARVTRDQFGIPADVFADTEAIFRSDDAEAYDRMRQAFNDGLAVHPDQNSVLRRCFVGPEFSLFLLTSFPAADLHSIKQELHRYYPICSIPEIERIEKPKSAADVLLRLRADEIANNVRLHRVFLKRRAKEGGNWSLSKYFSTNAFTGYVDNLPDKKREVCKEVIAGTAYLLNPNGECISTPWGPVIVISESLEYYLYYMNVFLMSFSSSEVSKEDASQALYIALRIMLRTETPDFDLDPRGEVPDPINGRARSMVQTQIEFVVGHEYAHVLAGHVRDLRFAVPSVLPPSAGNEIKVYSNAQEQEFTADLDSLLNSEWTRAQLIPFVGAAHWFFYGLDLLEEAASFLTPNRPPGQHPSARDRLVRLRKELACRGLLDVSACGSDVELAITFSTLDNIRGYLKDVFPDAHERLFVYGSQYLTSSHPTPGLDRLYY